MRQFWIGVFSDGGSPSSSRVYTGLLVVASIVWVSYVVFKTGHLPDGGTLTGLGAFAVSPYAMNSISKIGKPDAPKP